MLCDVVEGIVEMNANRTNLKMEFTRFGIVDVCFVPPQERRDAGDMAYIKFGGPNAEHAAKEAIEASERGEVVLKGIPLKLIPRRSGMRGGENRIEPVNMHTENGEPPQNRFSRAPLERTPSRSPSWARNRRRRRDSRPRRDRGDRGGGGRRRDSSRDRSRGRRGDRERDRGDRGRDRDDRGGRGGRGDRSRSRS